MHISLAYFEKDSGSPQVGLYWLRNLFSRSILVSPMRSSAESLSQSMTWMVRVWSRGSVAGSSNILPKIGLRLLGM